LLELFFQKVIKMCCVWREKSLTKKIANGGAAMALVQWRTEIRLSQWARTEHLSCQPPLAAPPTDRPPLS